MNVSLDEKNILLHAIGGGGDVVSASIYANKLRKNGYNVFLSTVIWERYVVDPEPGPIPLNNLINCRELVDYACIVRENTYAERSGLKIVPQATRIAELLGLEIIAIDIYSGVNGYYRTLKNIIEYYGLNTVIGIDVGGDVLAYGFEENLWSPLADSMGLAALNKFNQSYLMVHSLGSDGELSIDYLLTRLSIIIKNNGLIGVTGLTSSDRELLIELIKSTFSEASSIPLFALKGFLGYIDIRLNTRRVYVSPYSLVSFILNPRIVYSESLLARVVDNTNSLDEANCKLNKLGIYTEFDLERDLKNTGISRDGLNREILFQTRERGREKLINRPSC